MVVACVLSKTNKMTLYERLKPGIKISLESCTFADSITYRLSKLDMVIHMDYNLIIDMVNFLDLKLNYPTHTPYDWFND